jgi:nicotinamide-nucleotide amidase
LNVELINTGSELMLGRVLNTHQQWLCRRLADLGLVVTRQVAIADSSAEIKNAVAESLARADLIITTGGLGPTSDDLTRELIAELLGKKLIQDANVLRDIENYFARRNRPRPAQTRVEAFVPEGAMVLQNKNGTAPGLAMKIQSNAQSPKSKVQWLVMLPGPPRELRPMFDELVAPLLKRELVAEKFVCRTLRTSGIGESVVQEKIEMELQPLVLRGLEIGYCARPGAVDVRLSARGANAKKIVAAGEKIVQKNLAANIFGFDDDEMENVVVKLLTQKKKTLALAESCTGGLIANRITNVPGASEIFRGGIVAYSNAAKEKILGVRAEILKNFGAVSEAVAREMAVGAREKFGADFSVSVTGIAGPGGGTVDKPVGTVFICLVSESKSEVRKLLNVWERETFKQVTAQQVFAWLIRMISA